MNLEERLVYFRTYKQTRRVPGTHSDQQSTQNNESRHTCLSLLMAVCTLLIAGGWVMWECLALTVALGTVLFYVLVRRH